MLFQYLCGKIHHNGFFALFIDVHICPFDIKTEIAFLKL